MEDTSCHYTETLKCCRTFLVREYTIRPQVEELAIHLHEQDHISYNERQDISETVLTTNKMERLIGLLIDGKLDAKLRYDSLRHKFEEDGRTDIMCKLDEILEIVKISPKSCEEDMTEMVTRIKDDIMNVPLSEIHRCLTKVADYMAPQSVADDMAPQSVADDMAPQSVADYMALQSVADYMAPQSVADYMAPQSEKGESGSVVHHNRAASTSTEHTETQEDAYARLVKACEHGDAEMVVEITTRTPDCVNITNDNGETILMLSCQNGDVNVVKALLACESVDVNRRDRHGDTALIKSAVRGDVDVLSTILNCDRLDPSVSDDAGLVYLWYIFGRDVVDYLPILQMILKHSNDIKSWTLCELNISQYILKLNDLKKAMDWDKIAKVAKCLLAINKVDNNDLLKTCLTLGTPDLVSQILQSLRPKVIDKEMQDYSYEITASINPATLKVLLDFGMIDLNHLTSFQVEALIDAVTRHNDLDLCAHLSKLIRDLQVNRAMKTALFLQAIPPPILFDILEGGKYDLNIRDPV